MLVSVTRILVLLTLCVVVGSPVARAQEVGFVGGAVLDPEQGFVGTFYEMPPFAQSVVLRPGIDGAWGSGLSTASINIDVLFGPDVPVGWRFYSGVRSTITFTRFDDGRRPTPG